MRPGIGPDRHAVADRLVDDAGRHGVGVDAAVPGVDPARDGQPPARPAHRQDHRRVARPVVAIAHQGLDHGPALDLVVVLADDPFLAANVPVPEQGNEVGGGVEPLGQRQRTLRSGRERRGPGHRRASLVQEVHRQVAHDLAVVAEGEPAGGDELAEVGRLDVLGLAEGPQRRPGRRRHRQDHPFLRLRDPDLGVGEPLVLERGSLQVDERAEVGPHLADRRAEAPGAAVGDRMEEAAVAGLEDHVEHHLLGDRVADLHGAAGERLALAGQLGRAERRTVDPVASGSSSQGDDPVAGLNLLEGLAARQDADGAAEDQGIGEVARIHGQGPVDRGDPHPIAVVPHPGDDALEDALGVEYAGGKLVGREVGRRHAEDVGVADGLGPQAGPQGIADHAADARVRAAVRVDRGGVVVRLHLEADIEFVVEADHAGVVGEDADQPVEIQGLGGGEDGLLEQVVDRPPLELDLALERLVRAVLAPGLRQGLELAVGRVASQLAENAAGWSASPPG